MIAYIVGILVIIAAITGELSIPEVLVISGIWYLVGLGTEILQILKDKKEGTD